MKKTYRIFLASSYQLEKERTEFVKEMASFNDELVKKNVYLEVVIWEKLDAGNDPVRKQNFYNQQLDTCDLLVLAYWGQLGLFTDEEYQYANTLFQRSGKPRIYVFKKKTDQTFTPDPQNVENLRVLEAVLYQKDKAQWPWEFDHPAEFTKKIVGDIRALFNDPGNTMFTYGEPAALLSPNGVSEPTAFLGREDELEAIREQLDKGGRLMLINAEGGIGKTTLAAKYWHESLYHYKHNAWLFCENGIINALKDLAPHLNLDLTGLDEAQQLAALKQALKGVHSDCLLVLDNANDENEIKVFKQEFEGFHWHVLLTSRCAGVLDKSQELPITHLPPPLAKELFVRNYREDTPEFDALLDRLLLALKYHTLSIELFSKNMRELSERGGTLAEFVKHLETEGLFLGKRSFSVVTDYTTNTHLEARTSDEILDRFYNFARLSEPERFWLVNMALLPAEDYSFLFLCDLFTQDTIEFTTLHQLARKGWLTKTGSTFRLSPVIQGIALKKNEATLPQDAQRLLDRLNQVLETDGYTLLNISLTDPVPYVKPVEHLSKCLSKHPGWDIANYNFSAGIYYDNTGDIVSARKCYENISNIYQNLLVTDPENDDYKNGLAISYEKLGGIYEQTGDWQNALTNYQERNRIGKEIYASSPENLSYKNGLAISLARLGTFYLNRNEIGEALTHFLESRTLFQELWQATQGQIVQFTYYFALNTQHTTDIVKHLIETEQYSAEKIPSIRESIKAMRQEGYAALKPLVEAGTLRESQKGLYPELADESWYSF